MPISQKIKDQIDQIDATKDEKKLILTILEYEDQGVGRYKNTYLKEINAYIEQTECEK